MCADDRQNLPLGKGIHNARPSFLEIMCRGSLIKAGVLTQPPSLFPSLFSGVEFALQNNTQGIAQEAAP